MQLRDLRDLGRLMQLFTQAVARGIFQDSDRERLHWVAAAEHALRKGTRNPPGLFYRLAVQRQLGFDPITIEDEDRAMHRLKGGRRTTATPLDPAKPAEPHHSHPKEKPVKPTTADQQAFKAMTDILDSLPANVLRTFAAFDCQMEGDTLVLIAPAPFLANHARAKHEKVLLMFQKAAGAKALRVAVRVETGANLTSRAAPCK